MNEVELKPGYEQVFTVTGYYDGPLQGVANCKGRPHFYDFCDCVFDEMEGGYSSSYRLTPILPHIFQLALEDWAIWRRWEAAFHSGSATLQSHPALPQDMARHSQIKPLLDSALRTGPENRIMQGRFDVIGTASPPKGVMRQFQVRWTEPRS